MLAFIAIGDPAPQGSKKHVGNGVLVESSKRLRPWRATVTEAARTQLAAGHEPIQGAVDVYLVFKMRRPRTVTRDLPTVAPDIDKLARAVLDSLTDAGVWKDDCLVTSLTARKEYADFSPGVWIYVYNQGEERVHE